MRALIGLDDPVPLSVVHGVFTDTWLPTDQQPRYDVSFQQWTVSA